MLRLNSKPLPDDNIRFRRGNFLAVRKRSGRNYPPSARQPPPFLRCHRCDKRGGELVDPPARCSQKSRTNRHSNRQTRSADHARWRTKVARHKPAAIRQLRADRWEGLGRFERNVPPAHLKSDIRCAPWMLRSPYQLVPAYRFCPKSAENYRDEKRNVARRIRRSTVDLRILLRCEALYHFQSPCRVRYQSGKSSFTTDATKSAGIADHTKGRRRRKMGPKRCQDKM